MQSDRSARFCRTRLSFAAMWILKFMESKPSRQDNAAHREAYRSIAGIIKSDQITAREFLATFAV
jgi:hypothetical protein